MKQVDKNRMGPIWVAHIVTQMGPMWGHVFGLTGFISKSLSKLNEAKPGKPGKTQNRATKLHTARYLPYTGGQDY